MLVLLLAAVAAVVVLGYLQAPILAWTAVAGALLAYLAVTAGFGGAVNRKRRTERASYPGRGFPKMLLIT